MRIRVLIVFLLLASFGVHCAPKQTVPVVPKTYPLFPKLQSLSGIVEVTLKARGKERLFEAVLLIQGPDQMRISILDDLGQEHAGLIADGHKVSYWDREGEEEFPQDGKGLQKSLKLPLSVEEFITILLKGPGKSTSRKRFSLQMEDFKEENRAWYPYHWKWIFRRPKALLEFNFSSLNLNPEISPKKFQR